MLKQLQTDLLNTTPKDAKRNRKGVVTQLQPIAPKNKKSRKKKKPVPVLSPRSPKEKNGFGSSQSTNRAASPQIRVQDSSESDVDTTQEENNDDNNTISSLALNDVKDFINDQTNEDFDSESDDSERKDVAIDSPSVYPNLSERPSALTPLIANNQLSEDRRYIDQSKLQFDASFNDASRKIQEFNDRQKQMELSNSTNSQKSILQQIQSDNNQDTLDQQMASLTMSSNQYQQQSQPSPATVVQIQPSSIATTVVREQPSSIATTVVRPYPNQAPRQVQQQQRRVSEQSEPLPDQVLSDDEQSVRSDDPTLLETEEEVLQNDRFQATREQIEKANSDALQLFDFGQNDINFDTLVYLIYACS